MKHARIIVFSIVVLGLVGAALWQTRTFFLQNKVVFLLNQRQFAEAKQLIAKVATNDGDNLRTQSMLLKVNALTGQYDKVSTASVTDGLAAEYPEVLYWVALAELQKGHDDAAAMLAKDFVSSGKVLPDRASMDIVNRLAGKQTPLLVPDRNSDFLQLLFPLEKAVYLGLAGLQEKELGRVDIAADLFARAFAQGNRNNSVLLAAAEAAALADDTQRAAMFLDYSGERSIISIYDKLSGVYEEYKAITKTIHDREIPGRGGRLNVAHALSWAGTILLVEDVTLNMYPVLRIMADMQQEYPYDRVLDERMALIMEILSRYDEAYRLYLKLYEESPTLEMALRLWTLEAITETELTSRTTEFINDLDPLAKISGSDFLGAPTLRNKDYLSYHDNGTATSNFIVPRRSSYMLTMVARGDKAFSKWPLIRVSVDGEFAGYHYICRDSWDCYSLTLIIDAGEHTLEIAYVNDNESIVDDSEERSFYLRSIYVTNPGGV